MARRARFMRVIRRNRRRVTIGFTNFINPIVKTLTNPTIITIIILMWIGFQNTDKLKTWFEGKAALAFIGPAFKWMSIHINETLGASTTGVSILSSAPNSIGLGAAAIISAITAFGLKPSKELDYTALAVLSATFFRSRNYKIKIVTICVAIIAYAFGWLFTAFFK